MTIFHGIKTTLLQTGSRPINGPATSVIGLVATAEDADAATFPLDRPALITDVRGAIAKAGTQGTLANALAAIADQANATVVVVRVATSSGGQDALVEGTTASDGTYTGAKALLAAEAVVGVRPRIIGAPGLATPAVVAALVVVAKALRGMVYAALHADHLTDAVTAAAGYSDRELLLLWPASSSNMADLEARALGLRSAIDTQIGWHKSLSNVAIAALSGLAKDVSWSLDGSASDAATLNNANITTVIHRAGFRFWGNRTTSDVAAYAFETATRTSQALADAIEQGLLWASDQPLTAGLVKDILATINGYFRKLKAEGRIIGATAWFDPALNPSTSLANGQLVIDYDFTPVAPLEGLTENQRITDRYYADFSTQLTGVS